MRRRGLSDFRAEGRPSAAGASVTRRALRETFEPRRCRAAAGTRTKKEPQRTCVGCRATGPKAALLRLVRGEDGRLTLDRDGGASGRGAYACPTLECLTKAVQAGRLAHAFRRATSPGDSPAELLASWRRR